MNQTNSYDYSYQSLTDPFFQVQSPPTCLTKSSTFQLSLDDFPVHWSLTSIRYVLLLTNYLLMLVLRVAETLSNLIPFGCFHLHKMLSGPLPYTRQIGTCQMESHYISSLTKWVILLVCFSEGTQLHQQCILMFHPNLVPAGGCCCWL